MGLLLTGLALAVALLAPLLLIDSGPRDRGGGDGFQASVLEIRAHERMHAVEVNAQVTPEPTPSPEPTSVRSPSPSPAPAPAPDPTPAGVTPELEWIPTPAPTPTPLPVTEPSAVQTPPPEPGTRDLTLAWEITQMINAERVRRGLGSLTANTPLSYAAEAYARLHFIAAPYSLDHNRDGSPGDRARAAGYAGLVGEVLAVSVPNAQQIFDLWMASPPHHDVLMMEGARDIGMGCYQGTHEQDNGWVGEIALCSGKVGF